MLLNNCWQQTKTENQRLWFIKRLIESVNDEDRSLRDPGISLRELDSPDYDDEEQDLKYPQANSIIDVL